MNFRKNVKIIITLSSLFCIFLPGWGEATTLHERFLVYSNFGKTVFTNHQPEQIGVAMGEMYQTLFAKDVTPSNLKSTSSNNLNDLFEATNEAVFYTKEERYAQIMGLIINQLKSRKKLKQQQIQTLYKVYVSVRLIREAKTLKGQFPNAIEDVLPELREAPNFSNQKKSLWKVHPNSRVLERYNIDNNSDAYVIAIAGPKCHFSNKAVEAIVSDTELLRALDGKIRWLIPQARDLDFDAAQNWNRLHPEAQMDFIFLKAEWPEIVAWDTPNFYFFKDGILKGRLIGWPREGNKEKLIENLRKIGLLNEYMQPNAQ